METEAVTVDQYEAKVIGLVDVYVDTTLTF